MGVSENSVEAEVGPLGLSDIGRLDIVVDVIEVVVDELLIGLVV